ncbi:GNAT family N-acetyltransferase [Cohnella sp. 56]|uniref:GNAT family N-acetyltransferase n=1 Tax=Cohnella sp. 56 TaxID=3113722 RepID=UPI0030EB08BD
MREDIGIIERKTLNAWPALQQMTYGGWLLRQSRGYTKRSNSVQPLWTDPGADLRAMVGYCEDAYHRAGLPTIFKITPLCESAGLDGRLDDYGYRLADRSLVLVRSLDAQVDVCSTDDLCVDGDLTEEWLATASRLLQLRPEQTAIAAAMLASSSLRRGFFTLRSEGIPVAVGIGVIDDGDLGLYDIVTSLQHRNRGFGERLMRHILRWGQSHGAHGSYLQVIESNAAARRLYDKLGYRKLYEYWYRVRWP